MIEGSLEKNTYSGIRLTAKKIYTLEQIRQWFAESIIITWNQKHQSMNPIELANWLKEKLVTCNGGKCILEIDYYAQNAKAKLRFTKQWQVTVTDELLQELKKQFQQVEIRYKRPHHS
jgi:DNA polymerase III alpha subunit